MMKLIATLNDFVKELDEKYDGDPLVKRGVIISIAEAKKLLPEERKAIEDAWDGGYSVGEHDAHLSETGQDTQDINAEKYFDQNYEQ